MAKEKTLRERIQQQHRIKLRLMQETDRALQPKKHIKPAEETEEERKEREYQEWKKRQK